jgi:hypothetical protein
MRTLWQWLGWLALCAPFIFGQFGFDFSDFVGALDAELEGEIGALVEALIFVYDTLVLVTVQLASGLNFTYLGAMGLFQSIQQFFSSLWNDYILVFLAWLAARLQALQQWLGEKLQPLVDLLKRLVALQNQFYNSVLRPILNAIIALRRVVSVLHLFHLHFLDKLDTYLAGLEAKLLGNIFKVRQWVNQLLTWIEIFLNPLGFINRAFFMASVGNAADDILKLFTGQGVAFFSGPASAPTPSATPPFAAEDALAELQANITAGQGYFIDLATQGQGGFAG